MKQVIHKVYFIWEFEEEEKWLNEMAAKGLHLTDVGLCRYVFEEGEPGAYRHRLEMLEHWPNHPESRKYIEFMEETGAEYVGSLKNWVYFRKRREEGPFDLYSDIDSRIKHMTRIYKLLRLLAEVLGVVLFFYILAVLREWSLLGVLAPMAILEIALVRGQMKIGRKLEKLRNERAIRE